MTLRWVIRRLAHVLVTLFGITLLTFLALDLAPVDRATLEVMRAADAGSMVEAPAREAALVRLRAQYGVVDPVTLEPLPLLHRYFAWLGRALQLQFGATPTASAVLWQRFAMALPVSLLLGGLALLLAFAVGVPLGLREGLGVGSRVEQGLRAVLLTLVGVPEYLLGSLLLLLFCGWQWNVFPSHGLTSPGADGLAWSAQALDLAWHLALPVGVLAIGPTVLLMRFVAAAVARATRQPFALQLLALGMDENLVHARLRRHGAVPLATLAAGLLPTLVCGSVVVESLFSLNGIGQLAFNAVRDQDHAMLLLVTVVASSAILGSIVLSDLLHRWVDPRVRLVE